MRLKPSHLTLLTFAAACVGVFAYTAWRLRQPADLTPAQLLPPLQWMLVGLGGLAIAWRLSRLIGRYREKYLVDASVLARWSRSRTLRGRKVDKGARPRDQPSPPVHPVPESPAAASAECSRRHGIGP